MNATPAYVHLFGSLRRAGDGPLPAPLEGPERLAEVLSRLGIAAERVQLAMVNYQPASPEVLIRPGDRVALFPKEYPIFADWKDHRL